MQSVMEQSGSMLVGCGDQPTPAQEAPIGPRGTSGVLNLPDDSNYPVNKKGTTDEGAGYSTIR
jgi:hypothetical protein